MSKLCLAVSLLAFGVTLASGEPHAALRAGGTSLMPQLIGDRPNMPCNRCGIYAEPLPRDAVILNSRHLPLLLGRMT
jgi:hypothetical protein